MTRTPAAANAPRTARTHGPAWASLCDGVGRVLIAALFLYIGWFDMATHWPAVVDMVAGRGLPFPPLVAGAAMAFEIATPILLFVPQARFWATAALAAYCVATALLFHADKLFEGSDVTDAGFHFFKNLALAGAMLTSLPGGDAGTGRTP